MLSAFVFQTRYLATVGGVTAAETARNVMKRLMSSAVAVNCNWKGKGGKHAFGKTKLKTIVCGRCFVFKGLCLQMFGHAMIYYSKPFL